MCPFAQILDSPFSDLTLLAEDMVEKGRDQVLASCVRKSNHLSFGCVTFLFCFALFTGTFCAWVRCLYSHFFHSRFSEKDSWL
jgi:hypothetical protein